MSVLLAAIQVPGCTLDLTANADRAEAAVREAAMAGARIVALPEMATLPYFCGDAAEAYRTWAEPADGPLARRFSKVAAETGTAVFLPFYEHDASTGRYHNAVLGFGADGAPLRGGPVARKLHLPVGDDPPPGFDERAHFSPGDALHVVSAWGLRIGILVCYDRRFPEAWRALRRMGADLVVVPVAGSGGDDMDFFVGEMRTHARENGLAVLCANKVGDEHVGGGVVDNYGYSAIIDADGTVLALRPRAEGPGIVVAEIDTATIAATRRRLRYYDDRRVDLFV
ncbi:carbon-nitrogen hydrolase family protein [Lichenihabitans sp. Uapishka_5]|uniref:carbon-nitrogen hydrolase family protein n=1 Tax=Lichenihabitans sp. Uapishka_5 TaxID=3037302 RepID=UPI0029E825E6|nr:carbon-nitrogen hydrolase family protein [Lichenihabitans sp. Uapishka_5]MDX7950281.1 carbon-nitrogen hydrolase family protein [Lichenihabitans sp. Uapishka_5]